MSPPRPTTLMMNPATIGPHRSRQKRHRSQSRQKRPKPKPSEKAPKPKPSEKAEAEAVRKGTEAEAARKGRSRSRQKRHRSRSRQKRPKPKPSEKAPKPSENAHHPTTTHAAPFAAPRLSCTVRRAGAGTPYDKFTGRPQALQRLACYRAPSQHQAPPAAPTRNTHHATARGVPPGDTGCLTP
eukprot:362559-Chlamydomonas_euryale.AAC.1